MVEHDLGVQLRQQLRQQLDIGPGDVLVNPDQFFSPVRDMIEDGFTVRRFLDLCGAIEVCVLSERIMMVATRAQTAALADESSFASDIIAQSFFKGLAIHCSPELLMNQFKLVEPRVKATSANFRNWILPGDREDMARVSADIALVESVFWEETLQIPYMPTPQQAPHFASAQELPYRHLLYLKYGEARNRLLAARLREEYDARALPVPPISLQVLRSSRGVGDIGNSTLDQRARLRRLREICQELDELARDRSLDPAKKRTRRDRFQMRWRREIEKAIGDDHPEDLFGIPATTLDPENIVNVLGTAGSTVATGLGQLHIAAAVKTSATAVNLAPRVVEFFRGAPYRVLGTTIRRSLKTSPQTIDREVRRLFEHDVTNADLDLAYRLTDALPHALRKQVAAIHG
jgi:hypothetical protein